MGGGAFTYYVPAGQEDIFFGNGVTAKFRLTWDGAHVALYANNVNVTGFLAYTPLTPAWKSTASFTIGATSLNISGGGYYVSGDSVADFSLSPSTATATSGSPASLNPGTLTFTGQNVGTTSSAQIVTLKNTGSSALSITGIAVAGANPADFAQSNNCGVTLAAAANCSISVTFTPTATGTRSAVVNVTDSASDSPQSTVLSGNGLAAGTLSFAFLGNNTEISSFVNGSAVKPLTATAGLTGKVVTRGTGSAFFSPLADGDGVAFAPGGGGNTNSAFLAFSGTPIQSLFSPAQGDLAFYLKSHYTFANRVALNGAYQYAFEVDDGSQRLFYFASRAYSSRLLFTFSMGGGAFSYYVPAGQENTLFGNGITAKFRITWDGAHVVLYMNDVNVTGSLAYTPLTPAWKSSASFTIGATSLNLSGGGYYVSGDTVADFRIN